MPETADCAVILRFIFRSSADFMPTLIMKKQRNSKKHCVLDGIAEPRKQSTLEPTRPLGFLLYEVTMHFLVVSASLDGSFGLRRRSRKLFWLNRCWFYVFFEMESIYGLTIYIFNPFSLSLEFPGMQAPSGNLWHNRAEIGGGNGNSLHYSCLRNPMDRGAWWATVHEVSKESGMTEGLNSRIANSSWLVILETHMLNEWITAQVQRSKVIFQSIYNYPKFIFIFTSSLLQSYRGSLINYYCLEVPVHIMYLHNCTCYITSLYVSSQCP